MRSGRKSGDVLSKNGGADGWCGCRCDAAEEVATNGVGGSEEELKGKDLYS